MTVDVWLILGASSPVARAFARQAAEAGADLLLAARDAADLAATAADLGLRTGRTVATHAFDATDAAGQAGFVEAALAAAGDRRLGLFVAVGDMPDQAACLADPDLARRVMEVNQVALATLLLRILPRFRAQGAGAIVVLGSVAGDRGRRKNFVYGAAKAGLHAFLQGLRAELADTAVRVVTVKPGFLDTSMTWGQPGVFLAAAPEAAARACLRAAERGPEVIYVPRPWRLVMGILRAIPEPIFKRLPI